MSVIGGGGDQLAQDADALYLPQLLSTCYVEPQRLQRVQRHVAVKFEPQQHSALLMAAVFQGLHQGNMTLVSPGL